MTDVEDQQGWQPERCAGCGHASGEHKSGGGHGLHRVRRGVCLVLGCDCREFEEKPSHLGPRPTWQCEYCGKFYSERTAKAHGWCQQEQDRKDAESAWPA